MSELRKLLEAADNVCACVLREWPIGEDEITDLAKGYEALRNNAEKYAGMEERIAELESQLEASLGALREQMKARRDACARLGAVEGGLRIAAIYVRAALQGDGGQE